MPFEAARGANGFQILYNNSYISSFRGAKIFEITKEEWREIKKVGKHWLTIYKLIRDSHLFRFIRHFSGLSLKSSVFDSSFDGGAESDGALAYS